MLIKVELVYGDQVAVHQEGLDRLLEHDLVKRFKRSSGWVEVGLDPVRSKSSMYRERIDGYERRHRSREKRILH